MIRLVIARIFRIVGSGLFILGGLSLLFGGYFTCSSIQVIRDLDRSRWNIAKQHSLNDGETLGQDPNSEYNQALNYFENKNRDLRDKKQDQGKIGVILLIYGAPVFLVGAFVWVSGIGLAEWE